MLSILALGAVVAALVGAGSSAAVPPAKTPAYRHYVACGLSEDAKPAHVCPVKGKKGAFFKSVKANVKYTLCVKFPNNEHLCTETPQVGKKGKLYVNKISSTLVGRYEVTWFVKGEKVGTTAFRVK
ncbi:MAG TPA: hypothetical protein VMH33_11965 [Solirubrobacterales bacterium]|nr:hypothetical protein [Solirubrobacterales bacterium]